MGRHRAPRKEMSTIGAVTFTVVTVVLIGGGLLYGVHNLLAPEVNFTQANLNTIPPEFKTDKDTRTNDIPPPVRSKTPQPKALAVTPTPTAPKKIDKNCTDFKNQDSAQRELNKNKSDPFLLDQDKDGIACEIYFDHSGPPIPTTVKPPPSTKKEVIAVAPKQAPAIQWSTTGFGGVRSHVAVVGHYIQSDLGVSAVLGVAGRSGTSDHPAGLALDFMVYSDTSKGNAIADCVLRNKTLWNVSYVIWRQRINYGTGWIPMADRGSITANHFDHVHVSFNGASTVPNIGRGC